MNEHKVGVSASIATPNYGVSVKGNDSTRDVEKGLGQASRVLQSDSRSGSGITGVTGFRISCGSGEKKLFYWIVFVLCLGGTAILATYFLGRNQ